VQPCDQWGAGFDPVCVLDQFEEDGLGNILGRNARSEVASGDRVNEAQMAFDELGQGRLRAFVYITL
jgi:hypothetical protein